MEPLLDTLGRPLRRSVCRSPTAERPLCPTAMPAEVFFRTPITPSRAEGAPVCEEIERTVAGSFRPARVAQRFGSHGGEPLVRRNVEQSRRAAPGDPGLVCAHNEVALLPQKAEALGAGRGSPASPSALYSVDDHTFTALTTSVSRSDRVLDGIRRRARQRARGQGQPRQARANDD